jgi:hypothetical protein
MFTRRSIVAAGISLSFPALVGARQTPQPYEHDPVSRLVLALAYGGVDDIDDYIHPDIDVPHDLVEGIDEFRFWIIRRNAGFQEDYTDITANVMSSLSDSRWAMVYAQVVATGRASGYLWTHDWQITVTMDRGLIRTIMAASIAY